jgi:two-component system, sensor histidine kinase and response regulator
MKSLRNAAWPAFILLCGCGNLRAQQKEIARLRTTVREFAASATPVKDTAYVDTLDRLARAFYGIDADSAFFYGRKALQYAGRTGFPQGEAESWRMLGNTYEMIGDYQQMLASYQRSLNIAERIGDKKLIAKVEINYALFYRQEGEYGQEEQLMEKVRDLYGPGGDSSSQFAYVYSHLADLAYRRRDYDRALDYAGRALQGARRIGDQTTIANYNNDIGRFLAARGAYREALDHYIQSLAYYREANDRLGMTATNGLMAQVYLYLKNYPEALKDANASLEQARAMRRKPEIQASAKVLADIYEAKGDYRNALLYYRLYKDYSDSLFNDQARVQLLTRAAQADYEKKTLSMREAQAVKDAGYQRALRENTLYISVTLSVIAVLSLLAFILFRSRRVSRRVNRLLREKNEEIGEQKEQLEHQAVQLLLSNEQKDKLFSIIAHDLRGPLNSLKGLMDLLREKKLSEQEIVGMLGELRRNVDYSEELVGNLLSWAGGQLQGRVITPVLLPLREVVQEAFALFARQAREKGVMLTMELPPTLLGLADKDMIQLIVRNLVSNAIKFSDSGGVVTVGCRRRGAEIEICVADTGIGIPEEDLEKIRRKEIFSRFGTDREKGTGLGMLLCREFAEANRGQFYIESQWGKGTRCYFTIPVAPSSSSIRV